MKSRGTYSECIAIIFRTVLIKIEQCANFQGLFHTFSGSFINRRLLLAIMRPQLPSCHPAGGYLCSVPSVV